MASPAETIPFDPDSPEARSGRAYVSSYDDRHGVRDPNVTVNATLPAALVIPVADWLRENGQNIAEIALRPGTVGYDDVTVWFSRYDPNHHLVEMGGVQIDGAHHGDPE